MIIRSHGVPKRICDYMEEKGIEYVDATCPFVKKSIRLLRRKCEGQPDCYHWEWSHPEVEGIKGWAGASVP